jgi:hypothetical protein
MDPTRPIAQRSAVLKDGHNPEISMQPLSLGSPSQPRRLVSLESLATATSCGCTEGALPSVTACLRRSARTILGVRSIDGDTVLKERYCVGTSAILAMLLACRVPPPQEWQVIYSRISLSVLISNPPQVHLFSYPIQVL